jgi:hypothetical protein
MGTEGITGTSGTAVWRRAAVAGRTAAALALGLLASCILIGPSAPVSPGPGKSPAASDADCAACMRATDREPQPMANELNGAARRAAEVAADNARIQRMYDESYGGCMAGRGNVVPSPAPALSASAPAGPGLSNAHGGPAPVGGWTLLALSYHAMTGTPRDANDAGARGVVLVCTDASGVIATVSLSDGTRSCSFDGGEGSGRASCR